MSYEWIYSALSTQHSPTLGARIAVLRRFDVGWNKDIPSLNQIAPEYGIGPNTRQCLTRGLEPADEAYARKACSHPPPREGAFSMADVQKS